VTQSTHIFPIGRVSELTGVNSVTLRAWERRYGLITPARTDSGHRMYSEDDVRLIGYVLEQLERGIPISGIARQLKAGGGAPRIESDRLSILRTKIVSCALAFDPRRLERSVTEALSLFPVAVVIEDLLVPALAELEGQRERGNEGVFVAANFLRVFFRNLLGAQMHHGTGAQGAVTLVTASLPGERDDLDSLLLSLKAGALGFGVVPLGHDTPLHEIPVALDRTRAAAVVLAGSVPDHCAERAMQIAGLISTVDVPVFVGGRSAVTCRHPIEDAGGIPLGSSLQTCIQAIRDRLQANHPDTTNRENT